MSIIGNNDGVFSIGSGGNSIGSGGKSSDSSGNSINANVISIPSKPLPPIITYDTINNNINITWESPDNGGSDIISYTLTYSFHPTDNSSESQPIDISDISGLSYSLSNPTPDNIYTFQVTAINIGGSSMISEYSTNLYIGAKTTTQIESLMATQTEPTNIYNSDAGVEMTVVASAVSDSALTVQSQDSSVAIINLPSSGITSILASNVTPKQDGTYAVLIGAYTGTQSISALPKAIQLQLSLPTSIATSATMTSYNSNNSVKSITRLSKNPITNKFIGSTSELCLNIITLNYLNVSCYNENTKILTSNGYESIQNLRVGDMIKTYKHDYKKIKLIGKKTMINNPDSVGNCMYIHRKTGLIITGEHSILTTTAPKIYSNKMLFALRNRGKVSNINSYSMIDDMYLLKVYKSPDFDKIINNNMYTYYHIVLEGNREYGIWANEILTETTSEEHFLKNEFINLKTI